MTREAIEIKKHPNFNREGGWCRPRMEAKLAMRRGEKPPVMFHPPEGREVEARLATLNECVTLNDEVDEVYECLIFIITKFASCYCYAGYDIFEGFEAMDINQNITVTSTPTSTKMTTLMERLNFTTTKISKFKCPEEERPISIGSYEVPTQRDLVLLTKVMLTKLFNAYNIQALFLLKDIKEATKATAIIEKKCQEANKAAYRQCVKRVSNKSALIIKNLIASLENQKIDVAALTQEKICNLTSMKTDPLELIKILAQENATLKFALPGFLRLLSACSFYCSQPQTKDYIKKSPLLMTDLELVVKHFLTHFT